MASEYDNVVCPGCGCLCDDVRLSLDGSRLLSFEPECRLGRAWFESRLQNVSSPFQLRGKAVSLDQACDEAARLLEHADYPLIYGLSRSSTPGQRAAVALGEALGGVVDTTASLCHGPSIMAFQEIGEVTSTLGEVRNRADLIIFWGCNPARSHPRHAERYSARAPGKYLPKRNPNRRVVMIGRLDEIEEWQLDAEGTQPDLRIGIDPQSDFDVIRQLTLMHRGDWTGRAHPELELLLEWIRQCQYGVFFFGLGLAETGAWGEGERTKSGHWNVAALLHLVAELNATTRFTARRMRMQGDVSGADDVLCWQAAYPFAVDFSRGYPRYNPGEYSTLGLLERADVDAALIVGAETLPFLSPEAVSYLESIPTILIDYPGATSCIEPDVRLTTAVYGLHADGMSYRMDNVPLPLRKLVASDLPTDEAVLTRIRERISVSPTH